MVRGVCVDIDFNPLELVMSDIFLGVVKVLFIPFIASLLIGFILKFLRVPNIIARFVAIVIFLLVFYQMLITIQ